MEPDNIPVTTVEELTHRTQHVSCADNRLELCQPQNIPSQTNFLLLGKIISPKTFHSPIILEIVSRAWNLARPIKVKKVDRNLFAFSFVHEADFQLVFNRIPWTIRGAHLNLKVWNPNLAWQEIDFSNSPFWVQDHGIPLAWMNKDFIESIGRNVGQVLEVDFIGEPQMLWKRFVRVRINMNINAPFCLGIFLPRPGLKDLWISLKYERLLELCFRCGLIGHSEGKCTEKKLFLRNEFGGLFPKFGDWIKVENGNLPPSLYVHPSVTPTVEVPKIVYPTTVATAADELKNRTSKGTVLPTTTLRTSDSEVSSFARILAHSLKDACCDPSDTLI
jgi:hypothetical protein